MDRNKQKQTAIICESLFLANLLLLPLFCFLALAWYFVKYRKEYGWQRIHLYRSFQLSIVAGFILGVIPTLVIVFTHAAESSVMIMLVFWVTAHAGFVLIGMLNLSRAMARKLPLF